MVTEGIQPESMAGAQGGPGADPPPAEGREATERLATAILVDATRNTRRFNPRKASFSAWLYGAAQVESTCSGALAAE